jgi:hypothetical protein
VHQGPGGGAVVVNQGVLDAFEYTVSAYRLDGRRRWVNRKRASCGNCDEGLQPARPQADGTYGLIGVTGDDYWSVTQAGRRARGCTGPSSPTAPASRPSSPGGRPTLVAQRGAMVLWSLAEPDLLWTPEFDVAPFVVRDGSGTASAAYAPETEDGRLVAADAASGGLRARTPGSFAILGATEDAALALEGSALVAVGADGVRRWSTAIGRSLARRAAALDVPDGRGGRRRPRAHGSDRGRLDGPWRRHRPALAHRPVAPIAPGQPERQGVPRWSRRRPPGGGARP